MAHVLGVKGISQELINRKLVLLRFMKFEIVTVQCNLDLVTLNLVTTCDLVTIFQRPFFNLLQ